MRWTSADMDKLKAAGRVKEMQPKALPVEPERKSGKRQRKPFPPVKTSPNVGKLYRYIIGIDTGVNTGYAVWDTAEQRLRTVATMKIHQAMANVHAVSVEGTVLVRVEDARLRTWFGKAGREQLQGAGSVKRDAVIWQDYLTDAGIDYELVAPKDNATKMDADTFRKYTGWTERTNEHGRDAAMLVFNFKN